MLHKGHNKRSEDSSRNGIFAPFYTLKIKTGLSKSFIKIYAGSLFQSAMKSVYLFSKKLASIDDASKLSLLT